MHATRWYQRVLMFSLTCISCVSSTLVANFSEDTGRLFIFPALSHRGIFICSLTIMIFSGISFILAAYLIANLSDKIDDLKEQLHPPKETA